MLADEHCDGRPGVDALPMLTKSAPGRETGPAVAVAIVVVTGPDAGSRLELTRGTAIVGTLETCDLVLTDPTVSRQHLKLELLDTGLKAIDLNSRNGVWFNGSK